MFRCFQFVAGTQTINALAFVFDGINFGASDYTYSAYSMVQQIPSHPRWQAAASILALKLLPRLNQSHVNLQVGVASISIPCLVYLSAHNGFIGIWIALTIYMSLRTIASTWRYELYYPTPYPPHQCPFSLVAPAMECSYFCYFEHINLFEQMNLFESWRNYIDLMWDPYKIYMFHEILCNLRLRLIKVFDLYLQDGGGQGAMGVPPEVMNRVARSMAICLQYIAGR
jgi:hypothetical protein